MSVVVTDTHGITHRALNEREARRFEVALWTACGQVCVKPLRSKNRDVDCVACIAEGLPP